MPSLLVDRRNNLHVRLGLDNPLNVHSLGVDVEIRGHRAGGDLAVGVEEDGDAAGFCEEGGGLFLGVAGGGVVVYLFEIVEDLNMKVSGTVLPRKNISSRSVPSQ